MSKRSDGLIADSLKSVWNQVSNPNAGSTCSASVAPTTGSSKLMLTMLGWSIRNVTAAAYTATISVRDASIAGTVLAQWDILCPTAQSLQDNFYVQIKGLKGHVLSVDMSPPASSVTQRVSIGGWEDLLEV